MRAVLVYHNDELAGSLIEENQQLYVFRYDDNYYHNRHLPAISLTLPKTEQYHSHETLFPFFANMLSEGANRQLQSIHLRIDEHDDFGFLLSLAQQDGIGAVGVRSISQNED